jgi:general stress protein YciG
MHPFERCPLTKKPAAWMLRITQLRSALEGIDIMASTQKETSDHDDKKTSGKKGVTQDQVGSGKKSDPNNFANDPERAAEAGRKGGHQSHKRD